MEDSTHVSDTLETQSNHSDTSPTKPVQEPKSSLLKIARNQSNLTSGLSQQEIPQPKPKEDENVMVMTKYTAYWVNKKEEDKIYTVIVELPHLETVTEAIRDILPLINDAMLLEGSAYMLSEVPTYYEIYQAKKNGFPKTTYPALDYGQLLHQTYVQQISLVEKDPRAVSLRPNNQTGESVRPSMVESPMPMKISGGSQGEKQEEIVEQTVCWCFKKKVVVQRKKTGTNLSMQAMQPQQSLSASLLEQ